MPHPIVPYSRTAYAQGWAASGGPMTDAVKAGCLAAIDYAIEHATDPDVLEVTLHLGHLEGVWATIFDRRLKLHADNEQAVLAAWKPLVKDLPIRDMVRDLRQRAGLAEDAISLTKYLIKGAAQALMRWISSARGFAKLRQAIRDAIAAARAEGIAGALALAADSHGKIGFDFQIAFEHAYQALENSDSLWVEADAWVQRIVGGAASDVGDALAAAMRDGASYSDMVSAVDDVLGSGDVRAVSTLVDWATSQAMSRGALDLYATEGVTQVSYITAGDGRVCQACLDAEAGSPYYLADAPKPGLHPHCRCVLAAVTPPSLSSIARYLPSEG